MTSIYDENMFEYIPISYQSFAEEAKKLIISIKPKDSLSHMERVVKDPLPSRGERGGVSYMYMYLQMTMPQYEKII